MYWVSMIKQLCGQHGISQKDLAKLTGINYHTFQKNIQLGSMKTANLQKIADYFGVTVDSLVNPNHVSENPAIYRRLTESERLEIAEKKLADALKDLAELKAIVNNYLKQ